MLKKQGQSRRFAFDRAYGAIEGVAEAILTAQPKPRKRGKNEAHAAAAAVGH
jgi:hypothetical protein